MRLPAVPVALRAPLAYLRLSLSSLRPAFAAAASVFAVIAAAAPISLPLTTGESGKISVGTFAGGAKIQLSVTGAGDLVDSRYQTNPDGSLAAVATSPYGFTNAGATFGNVSGFPLGDGVNHFYGGGSNYDFSGSGWMFAGKQTTDTTDPAVIRAGAVVGTFATSPTRADWFLIGFGRTVTVPAGGATLYIAVNDTNSTDNHGTYSVTVVPLSWNPATEFSIANGNPNGVWRYGSMDTGFTTFTPYVNKGSNGSGYLNWYGAGSDSTPTVALNAQTTAFNGVPSGYLLFHPGSGNEPSVLRWTAPLSATLRVTGQFHAGDAGAMQVAVRRNSAALWSATDAGAFDLTTNVTVGDTIDFAVYGGFLFGSTGLQVSLSASTTSSLPLTTGESAKLALGTFTGGSLVRISVAGTGDLVDSRYQTNPDGSLTASAGSPWGAANVGAGYPSVSGFPSGDGVNHFVGGGQNYDSASGSGWTFAGKQTTDTTDPAAIRYGAVVGTFVPNPTRADWFAIGFGGTLVAPLGGATLYVAVNESVLAAANTDNHGAYSVTVAPANEAFAAVSTFAASAEGWGVTSFASLATNNYAVVGTYAATFNTAGGNVGGYISSNDPDGGDFAFSAPAAFLGNRTSSIGATLAYQLIHPIGSLNYPAVDVVLVGNGVRLVWKSSPAIAPAAASWTNVTVPLAPSAQWHVSTTEGAVATAADFQTVLGNLTGLFIRGEYTDGAETTGIDNVVLGVASSATPVINSISSSTVIAGMTVTLTGSGFTGATAVNFNGTAATSFAVVSDLTLTAVVPVGATAGTVTVTTPGGTSATTVAFTIATPSPTANDRFDPGADGDVLAAVVQPDGKILISGNFTTLQPFGTPAATPRAKLARLNRDGTIDPSFLATASLNAAASVIALEPDGKILLAGAFTTVNGVTRNRLARLLPDGSLDSTFDPNANGIVTSLVRQPDSKILIGGEFTSLQPSGAPSSTSRSYLARLNADGSLDSAFNIVFDNTGGTRVDTLALQADGAVLVGGRFTTVSGSGRINLARFTAAGVLDASFVPTVSGAINRIVPLLGGRILVAGAFTAVTGLSRGNLAMLSSSGAVETFNPTANGTVTDAVAQADGKIVVAGEFTLVAGGTHNRVARLLPDGTQDASFTTDVNNTVRLLALQPDGSLLVAGDFTTLSGHGRSRIARVLPDGSLERALIADAGTGVVGALAVQPDGKIFVGGHFTTLAGQARNYVARLNADGTLDSFNPSPDASVIAPIPLPGGKFLLGGRFTTIAGQARTGLARFNADSTFDAAFNAAISGGTLNSAVLQSDGKIVIGGTFTSVGGQTRNRLARLNSDGTLDVAFNPDVNGEVYGLALQGDGAIVFTGGFTQVGVTSRNRVARVSSAGVLDPTFDPNANGLVQLATVQADGKIILAGAFTTVAGQARAGYARVTAAGALDAAFDPSSTAGGVTVVQADGKIVVGGVFNAIAGTARSYVARLNADGTIDSSFDVFSDGNSGALAIQPDGKLIVGGDFLAIGGQTRQRLARLNATGPTATVISATTSTVTLTRSGPLPELAWVTFEKSTDRVTWTPLGAATRVGTTANWQLTGQAIPQNATCYIRACAASPTGVYGASSLVEHVQQVYLASVGPVITTQPISSTVAVGASVTLSVTATGANDYQWVRNGNSIPNATSSTLTFSPVSLANWGNYHVLVNGPTGTTQSNGVTLTITTPVPVPIVSSDAVLKSPRYLATDGTDWFVSGVRQDNSQAIFKFPVAGGAVSSLYAGLASPLSVSVLGTDVYWIDPNAGPSTDTKILKAPKSGAGSVTALYTGSAVGEPLVDGSGLVTNGTSLFAADEFAGKIFKLNLDGTGFTALTSGSRFAASFASERLITLAHEAGILYIADAGRSGADSPSPQILSFPVAGSAFTSLASGSPLVSPSGIAQMGGKLYVADPGAGNTIWQLPSTGGTPTLYYSGTPFASIAGIAAYNGELYVADTAGGAIFRFAQTAATPPVITAPPAAVVTTNGANVAFSVTATGVPAVTYQWRLNGQPISGATNSTLPLNNVGGAQVGNYSVTVTNGLDAVTSAAVALTGPVAEPVFVTQPVAYASANVGASLTLTVSATAATGLTYQWRKHGQPLTGATGASLTLSNLTLFESGLYDVVVTTSGVGFPSTASRVVVQAPVPSANLLTASSTFAPRFESKSASFSLVHRAADGKVYVSGNFTSLFGALRPGFARLLADGSLDTTFVPASVSHSYYTARIYSVAVQTDGRVLVVGQFDTVGGLPRECLARLNPDGSLDASFVPPTDLVYSGRVNAVLVQPDGKIFVAGSFYESGINLARLLPDGSRDATFVVGEGFNATVEALALQGDGKLIAGGDFTRYNKIDVGRLVRLSTTGALDTAYGTAGGSAFDGRVRSLVLQSDGKLLAGGDFISYNGTDCKRLARLLETGALDASFATGTGFNNTVSQVALQSDGTILAAGDFQSFADVTSSGLVRLTSTGGRDTTFITSSNLDASAGFNDGTDGVAVLSTGVLVLSNDSTRYASPTANVGPLTRLTSLGALDPSYAPAPLAAGSVNVVTPAPDGRWLVGGAFTHVNGVARPNLARLLADGTLDPDFVLTGTGLSSSVEALAVQADGRVLVGGRFTQFNSATANCLVRLTTTGALDATFETGSGFNGRVAALALQADGKVVVGGSFSSYNGTARNLLVRLSSAGALDSTFAQTGVGLGLFGSVNTLALLADGRLYAGGEFTAYNSVTRYRLARFLSDGTLDPAFVVGEASRFSSTVDGLVVQPDGKLLVSGQFYSVGDFSTNGLARLTDTGIRDATFGAFMVNGAVTALHLQSDGRIVVGGSFTQQGYNNNLPSLPHLARLSPSGVVETTFVAPGFASTPRVIQPTATGALLVAGDALVFPGGTSPGLARLDAAPTPTISTPPATQIASVGATATFNVTASGSGLAYQWRKDGVAVPGANGTSFTLTNVQLADAISSYSVTVTNAFGSVTSASALLTGSGAAPTLTGNPASTTVAVGATATITVNATGATHYQWRKLGVPILGATAATLSLPEVTLGAAGLYDVLVGNGLTLVRSPVARLTVTPSATIQNPLTADRSFGAVFESANNYGFPSNVFAQPDGSYYIVGSESFSSIDGEFHFGLARFNAAGVLDSTFTPEISGGSINALARQTDGKLVLVGDFHRVNGVECNHLARLNANGSLDTTFTHGYGTGTYDSLFAVAVQSDGKILVGGDLTSYSGDASGGRLARLNANGSLDTSFRTALGEGFNATVRGLALHSDGRIYVVGDFTLFNGSNTADHIVALNPDGTRFALPGLAFQTFGPDRSAILSADASLRSASTVGNGTTVTSILVLSDGKMIVGGYFYTFGETIVRHLVGLNADGSRDSGFSAGGGASGSITQLLRQSDGRLYATGDFGSFDSHTARVVRLTATGAFESGYHFDGTPAGIALGAGNDLLVVGDFQTVNDPKSETSTARSHFARFDASGVLAASQITRWGSLEGYVETIVPAPGGKWLVGGYFARVGGRLINNLARINADGSADTTFSSAQSPLYDTVRAIAVQGDGKILVGGGFTYYGADDSYQSVGRCLRLNADGTRDLGFNLGSGFDGTVYAIAVQADGKILVGGEFSTLNGKTVSHGLVRLLCDGSIDSTFQAGTGFLGSVATLAVQNDDKILVGGDFSAYNSATSNATRLVRLHANGVLETAFAISGDTVSTILLQPNGDILIGGTFTSVAGVPRTGVARFNSAGVFDATFNSGSLFDLGEGYASVRALALQADGKLIVGGDFPAPGESSGTQQLLRLTATGALDSTFAPNTYSSPRAVALRADGGVLLAGSNLDVDATYRYGLIAIAGAPPSSLPTITTSPVAQSAVFGGTATFSVTATGTPPPTYQWQRNGENVSGATQATYTVTSASQATAGLYRVIVTNVAGSVPSAAVPLDVVTRNLINFYARAIVAPGGTIASSFTIEGTQPKTVLIVGVGGTRAATASSGGNSNSEIPSGPARLDPPGLADPSLTVIDSAGTLLGSNDNWTTANVAALSAASTQVAATPGLTATGEGANDAALLLTLAPGTYTATLFGAGTTGGAALLQIYDADTDSRPRLVMFTLRANVGSGANVATAGFTVDGTLPKTVLLRALGESLGYSPGVLIDPVVTLFRGNTQIDRNDDTYYNEGDYPVAVAQVGARRYNGTLDSTLVSTLLPGAYTAQLTPYYSADSGTVLFELFEADAQRATTIAPVVTYLSPNQTAVQGESAAFAVVVVAKPAATYQWRKNGSPIDGATSAVLSLFNVQPGDDTTYDVVVTSGANSVTTQPRALAILPEFHSADSDRDHRIGLLELTRIIQFYNHRVGTVRTGEYHTQSGTEDGFTLGPGAISTYHSADANRDGRLDVLELTRVIELYNYTAGTVRTGDYHAAVGTEDGFTPGPREFDRIPATRGKK